MSKRSMWHLISLSVLAPLVYLYGYTVFLVIFVLLFGIVND